MQVYGISNFGSTKYQTQNINNKQSNYMAKINPDTNRAAVSFGAYLNSNSKAVTLFNEVIALYNKNGTPLTAVLDGADIKFDHVSDRSPNFLIESTRNGKNEVYLEYCLYDKSPIAMTSPDGKSTQLGYFDPEQINLFEEKAIKYLTTLKTKYAKANNV